MLGGDSPPRKRRCLQLQDNHVTPAVTPVLLPAPIDFHPDTPEHVVRHPYDPAHPHKFFWNVFRNAVYWYDKDEEKKQAAVSQKFGDPYEPPPHWTRPIQDFYDKTVRPQVVRRLVQKEEGFHQKIAQIESQIVDAKARRAEEEKALRSMISLGAIFNIGVTMCGTDVPRDLLEIVLSYWKTTYDHEILTCFGMCSWDCYLVVLTTWRRLRLGFCPRGFPDLRLGPLRSRLELYQVPKIVLHSVRVLRLCSSVCLEESALVERGVRRVYCRGFGEEEWTYLFSNAPSIFELACSPSERLFRALRRLEHPITSVRKLLVQLPPRDCFFESEIVEHQPAPVATNASFCDFFPLLQEFRILKNGGYCGDLTKEKLLSALQPSFRTVGGPILPHLRTISFEGQCGAENCEIVVRTLQRCPGLVEWKTISCSADDQEGAMTPVFAALGRLPLLQKLRLDLCDAPPDCGLQSWGFWASLSHISNIQELELTLPIIESFSGIDVLFFRHFSTLEIFKLVWRERDVLRQASVPKNGRILISSVFSLRTLRVFKAIGWDGGRGEGCSSSVSRYDRDRRHLEFRIRVYCQKSLGFGFVPLLLELGEIETIEAVVPESDVEKFRQCHCEYLAGFGEEEEEEMVSRGWRSIRVLRFFRRSFV